MVAGKSIRLSDLKAPCVHGDGGRVYRRLEIFNSHRSCLRCVSPSYFRKLDIVGMSSAPAAFAQRPGISSAAFVEIAMREPRTVGHAPEISPSVIRT